MIHIRTLRDSIIMTIGRPAYDWGSLVIAAVVTVAALAAFGTFISRTSDTAITTVTIIK